jgi:hypothetical protein
LKVNLDGIEERYSFMRLWSLCPEYLDTQGLLALWRESLLAQKVLLGQTKGYKNHPQLDRFKAQTSPRQVIGRYLLAVWGEADRRGYAFDLRKVKNAGAPIPQIAVTRGQLQYEWEHLRKKMKRRDPIRYGTMEKFQTIKPHPLFKVKSGPIEKWERI